MCVHADDMSVVVPYRDLNPDPYHGQPQNLTNLTMYSFFDIDRLLDAIVKIGMVRAWPSLAQQPLNASHVGRGSSGRLSSCLSCHRDWPAAFPAPSLSAAMLAL